MPAGRLRHSAPGPRPVTTSLRTRWLTSTNLSAVQVWLDAGVLSQADGAAVTGTWRDRSTNGTAATANGTLTMKRGANGINGLPAVLFDGSTGYLQIADRVNLRITARMYAAAVIKTGSIAAAKSIFQKGSTAGTPNYLFDYSRSSNGALGFYDGSNWNDSTGTLSANTPYLVEAFFDGSNWYFYINGTAAGTVARTSGLATSTDPLFIGRQGSTNVNSFDGLLAELIVVGMNGSAEMFWPLRQQVLNYLGSKYALAAPFTTPAYAMAYNGTNNFSNSYQIGVAFSQDGLTWSKGNYNRAVLVASGSGFDATMVKDPSLVHVGGTYYLFYSGFITSTTTYQVGLATSTDGVAFTRYGSTPILPVGGGGTWDSANTRFASVVYDTTETNPTRRWKMWYAGDNGGDLSIGYAYSADGKTWTKSSANPVLSPGTVGTYDGHSCNTPCVIKQGRVWHLYYGGRLVTTNPENWTLCRATFTDPEGTYTKDPANPLLSYSTANQNLTANCNSGTNVVTVGNTTGFHAGEPVFFRDSTNAIQLTKVLSVDSGTQMHTVDNASQNWTTANTASIRSAYCGSITPKSVLRVGASFVHYATAFQQFAGNPYSERSIIATAPDPGGPWSFDYTHGIILPLGSSWDTVSVENNAAIAGYFP